MSYRVEIVQQAIKQLENIKTGDHDSAKAIASEIRALSKLPRPYGSINLGEDIYRIRVRDYRIIYGVNESHRMVEIYKISRRRETTYKDVLNISKRFQKMLGNIDQSSPKPLKRGK